MYLKTKKRRTANIKALEDTKDKHVNTKTGKIILATEFLYNVVAKEAMLLSFQSGVKA